MTIFWTLIGKPLAAFGGRSFEEMRGRSAGDCDKSIAVGLMGIVSTGVIFGGHWLFWRNFAHVADMAVWVAAAIALLFAIIYRVSLRALETMGGLARAATLGVLMVLMGINAMLAGHELVLLAFKPQVEAEAQKSAAEGVTTYADTVGNSLGLPQLRNQGKELDQALGAAKAERSRLPESVLALQQQAMECEALAARLQQLIPADLSHAGWRAAHTAWRQQRGRCSQVDKEAKAMLKQHQDQADATVADLERLRLQNRKALAEANARHDEVLRQDSPTLTASATTGFARHTALWAAVEAGTVPAWAAHGLMAAVLVIDAFSFLIKLLARDDRATADRVADAGADAVFNTMHAALVRQQRRLTEDALLNLREQTVRDMSDTMANLMQPAMNQGLDERAFARAASAHDRAQRARSGPTTSMLGRLGNMAQAMRRRVQPTAARAAV